MAEITAFSEWAEGIHEVFPLVFAAFEVDEENEGLAWVCGEYADYFFGRVGEGVNVGVGVG